MILVSLSVIPLIKASTPAFVAILVATSVGILLWMYMVVNWVESASTCSKKFSARVYLNLFNFANTVSGDSVLLQLFDTASIIPWSVATLVGKARRALPLNLVLTILLQ